MLEVHIKKHLDKYNLDIDFKTDKKTLGFLGASGSGKSMTLKCISGIEKPDEGYISLDGKVLYDSANGIDVIPQKRKIGYMFQNYALFPQINVYQNIFVSVNDKYDKKIRNEKTLEIINDFNLDGLQKKYPYELSGGEQQRVALARIIVNEAEFLLLDEPFSAIDSFLKWKLAKELKNMLNEYGKGAIFVSHNINEIYLMCDDAIIISNGMKIEENDVKNIIENPQKNITKDLVNYSNLTIADIDRWKIN